MKPFVDRIHWGLTGDTSNRTGRAHCSAMSGPGAVIIRPFVYLAHFPPRRSHLDESIFPIPPFQAAAGTFPAPAEAESDVDVATLARTSRH